MNYKLPKSLQAIKKMNINFKVKLRFRQTNESLPYLLYLDLVDKDKRKTKALNLKVIGNAENKVRDGNTIQKALKIRLQFQEVYDNDPDNFSFNSIDQKNFINFFRTTYEKKNDKNYRLAYNKFIDFISSEYLEFKKINFALCEDFKEYLLKLDITNRTAKHYFTCFSCCLNDAVRRDLIEKNPARGIVIKFQRKAIERLTESEVKKLWLTPCNYHDLKNGFLFSCFTGLRLSDILDLKLSDINNGKIKVIQNKTLNEVEIPLHSIAKKILKIQKKLDNHQLFHIPNGGKTSKKMVQWMTAAGINKDITFHCARHTFGCLLVENDVSLFVVKKLMGHRKIETTLQYIDKANIDAGKAIDTLPKI
ncbi:MAG: site-specific integrase [Candidatus Tenebribacter davisii]|nr:site-specific integrase [Candidatus Tenebribacter davisii]